MSAEHQPALRIHQPDQAQSPPPLVTGQATVAAVLDWYETNPTREIHSTVAERERRRIWGLLRVKLGDKLVADVRAFELLNFIGEQKNLQSKWTRKRWNTAIQRPFNFAERLGLITKNPFRGLVFREGKQGRDWTKEELQTILRLASPPFRRLIIGLRFSGLRPGEGCNLQWSHIDTENCIVIRDHKTSYCTDDDRVVPLNNVLAKLFVWLKLHNPAGSKHVFMNAKRRRWTRTWADETFRLLREKAGLPDDLKLHGARHTFGTNAVLNGVALSALAAVMGHKGTKMTERYVHVRNKVGHLADAMQQAVTPKPKPKPDTEAKKPDPPAPLFDGLQ